MAEDDTAEGAGEELHAAKVANDKSTPEAG